VKAPLKIDLHKNLFKSAAQPMMNNYISYWKLDGQLHWRKIVKTLVLLAVPPAWLLRR
jgi:hypothetical protein